MFRIREEEGFYFVEIQKTKWYGKKYWTPYISYLGNKDRAYPFCSHESAFINLTLELKRDIKYIGQ